MLEPLELHDNLPDEAAEEAARPQPQKPQDYGKIALWHAVMKGLCDPKAIIDFDCAWDLAHEALCSVAYGDDPISEPAFFYASMLLEEEKAHLAEADSHRDALTHIIWRYVRQTGAVRAEAAKAAYHSTASQ